MEDVVSSASCGCSGSECLCVIDISSPATLERDFHAWLLGVDPSVSEPFFPNIDLLKQEIPDYVEDSGHSSSPPEPPSSTPVKTDLRKVRRKGTNLYGRPYCPGRPLSMEERTRIIELHMNGMKVNAISKALCISHGCVSKIISRYRSTGILTPASSPEQRRTRRVKKSDSSPDSLPEYKQEPFTPLEYHVPLQFLPTSPPDVLTPAPLYAQQPLPHYTVLHDPMMIPSDYHPQILL